MSEQEQVEIPADVPVMTLSNAVLFPGAILPLHIFEPRYRAMLEEVLGGNRIFAVAGLDDSSEANRENETPFPIAGIGVVRACRKNADGTANLILQGLARVRFERILSEEPFRRARVQPYPSQPGGPEELMRRVKPRLLDLIRTQIKLGAAIPREVLRFLRDTEGAEEALDLAISTLCASDDLRQELLETAEILARAERFSAYLGAEIRRLKLEKQLRGELDEEDFDRN